MKKLVYLAAALIMPWTAMAQNSSSKLTLTPRIGATIANFSGSTYSEHYSPKGGFIAGADVEYRISQLFGVSAGIYYNMQGAKENAAVLYTSTTFPDQGNIYLTPGTNTLQVAIGKNAHIDFDRNSTSNYLYITDIKDDLRYLSIPVIAEAHVWKGLAVKLGVQWDHLLSAHLKAKEEVKLDGTTLFDDYDQSFKKQLHNDAIAIPVGLSYSYKNIELDARYLWGITKISDINSKEDKDLRNSTFAITLGYNFHL